MFRSVQGSGARLIFQLSGVLYAGSVLRRESFNRHGLKTSPLIPGYRQQIRNPAPEPVPNAIFGNACDTGPMVDGKFQRSGARSVDENGQKPVHSIER